MALPPELGEKRYTRKYIACHLPTIFKVNLSNQMKVDLAPVAEASYGSNIQLSKPGRTIVTRRLSEFVFNLQVLPFE